MLYESIALPLSYVGDVGGAQCATKYINRVWGSSKASVGGAERFSGSLRFSGCLEVDL